MDGNNLEDSEWGRDDESEPLSEEELRKVMLENLVKRNTITKEDSKKQPEEETPEEDKFRRATDYLLGKHKPYFRLYTKIGAYCKAVEIARCFYEKGIIPHHDKKYKSTFYYFEKGDKETMKSIDSRLIEDFPEGYIPRKRN